MKDRQKAALAYAKLVKLVPVHGVTSTLKCTCRDPNCNHPGKHPRVLGGVNAATDDPKQIRAWWTKWPDAIIGMATGKASGIDVVDIDPRNGGTKTLAALVKNLGPLPKTAKTRTGGKGFHFLVKHLPFPVKKGSLGPGIDYLTDGAIAILPPSHHHTGGVYQHVKHHNLLKGVKPKRLPKLWCDRLKKGKLSAAPAPQAVIMRGAGAIKTGDKTGTGARNTTLTKFAGALVRAGCTGQALLAALQAHNAEYCNPPLEADELQKIAASIGRYSSANDGEQHVEREYKVLQTLTANLTADQQELMFLPGQGFWKYANGVWLSVKDKVVEKMILSEVEKLPPEVRGKTTTLVSDVLRLMMVRLTQHPDPLHGQSPRSIINCLNGEVHLGMDGTAKLRNHAPTSGLTSILSVTYDPAAKCPLYDRALRSIFQDTASPKAMAAYWNEFLGYLIQPSREHAIIIMLMGEGSNGKSEVMRTVQDLIGSEFVFSGRIEELDRNRFAMGYLRGKFLFYDDDIKAGMKLPDGLLKKISEAKWLTGELKNRDSFTFMNTAVPVLSANNPPTTSDLSYGLRRRIVVIPFGHMFQEGKDLDRNLWPTIRETEMSGILNRATAGLARLRKRGHFQLPTDVAQATERWLHSANPLNTFLAERTTIKRNARTLIAEIYTAYTVWADQNGVNFQLQKNNLGRQLKQLGYNVGDSQDGSIVIGLVLKV